MIDPKASTGPTPQLVDIDRLHASDWNPRSITDANMESLMRSITNDPDFMWHRPILARENGEIYAGHQRFAAVRRLGWLQVPAIIENVSAEVAKERALRDNNQWGTWEDDALSNLLAGMRGLDVPIVDLGFDQREIDHYLSMQTPPPPAGQDDADLTPPKEPVTKPGDLWILGDHRLLCGDSTNPDDPARVMNGELAVLFATDSPYLVNYTAGNHPPSDAHLRADGSRANPNKDWDEYHDPAASVDFFVAYLENGLRCCIENVAVYNWHASRRQALLEEAWLKCGLFVHQQIIWVKERPVLTRSWYMWQHEPCFMGWRPGHMPKRPSGNFTATSTWQVPADPREKDVEHPTIKPVEVFAIPMRQHTLPGDVCFEPFLGSGTQIIAGEQLGRRVYAIEKEPDYCDVAIRRWERVSGKQAILEATGQTFAAVISERAIAPVDVP